jgi:hypothetical protein
MSQLAGNSRTISWLLDCVSRKIKIDVAVLPDGDSFVPAVLFHLLKELKPAKGRQWWGNVTVEDGSA